MSDVARMVQIEVLAAELMGDWGLLAKGWRFGWNGRRSHMGVCVYRRLNGRAANRIELSRHMVGAPDAQVRDTILHEIAHALAGPKAGHGPAWRAWAAKVGASPERCADGSGFMPRGDYEAACPCGTPHRMHRMPRCRYQCKRCGHPLTYRRAGK